MIEQEWIPKSYWESGVWLESQTLRIKSEMKLIKKDENGSLSVCKAGKDMHQTYLQLSMKQKCVLGLSDILTVKNCVLSNSQRSEIILIKSTPL